MKNILHTSNIKSLKKIYQGKVRDIYEVDANNILMVSTDRVSVFDTILPTPIPEKGIILNKVSNFWFKKFSTIVGKSENNNITKYTPIAKTILINQCDVLIFILSLMICHFVSFNFC